jgi:hypothetical protein
VGGAPHKDMSDIKLGTLPQFILLNLDTALHTIHGNSRDPLFPRTLKLFRHGDTCHHRNNNIKGVKMIKVEHMRIHTRVWKYNYMDGGVADRGHRWSDLVHHCML